MISVKLAKCLRSADCDYVFEHVDDYFAVLPYLYGKIEGKWHVSVMTDSVKSIRDIFNTGAPESVQVDILSDQATIEQFLMEKPSIKVEGLSAYEQYMELFKTIQDVVFEPRAVSEIYHRAGPNIEALEQALKQVITESNHVKVTMADVDKVLLPNNSVYASDIVRVFLRARDCKYRWKLVDRFINNLGQSFAYYSIRKYVQGLLSNKVKYLHNEQVAEKFKKDVESIDAFTIIHAYQLFLIYSKPQLLRAILYELERRNFTNVSVHT